MIIGSYFKVSFTHPYRLKAFPSTPGSFSHPVSTSNVNILVPPLGTSCRFCYIFEFPLGVAVTPSKTVGKVEFCDWWFHIVPFPWFLLRQKLPTFLKIFIPKGFCYSSSSMEQVLSFFQISSKSPLSFYLPSDQHVLN